MTSMSPYQSFIHMSRYSRWMEDLGRRETWDETVDRYINFMCDEQCEGKIPLEVKRELRDAIYNLEVMPSMRAMMTAGPALSRDNVAGFNCAYMAIDDPRAFDEMMYILMCGTGVGFSVERQFIAKLPRVAETLTKSETTICVKDSKVGWSDALKELISLLYSGRIPKIDTSCVRKAGERLKTFGGRASGPAPLEDLFKFIISIFKSATGRKLNSIECHDICCKIGEIVVVGGVRRSAEISLSNPSDDRMRHAKSGEWWKTDPHRALANNSACYTEKPGMQQFMSEWVALYESKSGERGIFNREAATNQVAKFGRRDPGHEWGCNPCCFTADMQLLTAQGYKTFGSLAGNDVKIINPNGAITNGKVWSSGIKPIIEVVFEKPIMGNIKCTPDHIYQLNDGTECEAKDLKGKRVMPNIEINRNFSYGEILAGYIQGDGGLTRLDSDDHKGMEVYFGQDDGDVAKLFRQPVGVWYSREARAIAETWNLDSSPLPEREMPSYITHGFLMGMYSANGCVIRGSRISYKTTSKKLATQLIQALKDHCEIDAYYTTNKPKDVEFQNGIYECKESYDVNISKYVDILKFAKDIAFVQQYKCDALYELLVIKAPYVKAIKELGEEEVFDFTEPDTHWGIVNGCVVHNSEIILRSQQFCNLSEVIVRADDTEESLMRKARLATILGTMQASLSNFRYLREGWRENTEEEALLGVSLTGIVDNEITSGKKGKDLLKGMLNRLRDEVVSTNKEWASLIGINQAAATTCVKPSGTVSQLVDCSSGIHTRHSEYFIRRVRADIKDPLALMMMSQGFNWEPDVTKPDHNAVFQFAMKSPTGAITRDQMSALDQLDLWLMYQLEWCEHKPSCTINVKEHEWMEVGAWVYKHFDVVSGISFLPYSDHTYQQAPYEECDVEEYEKILEETPDINWSQLSEFELEDTTTGSHELACSGTNCELVDNVKE